MWWEYVLAARFEEEDDDDGEEEEEDASVRVSHSYKRSISQRRSQRRDYDK